MFVFLSGTPQEVVIFQTLSHVGLKHRPSRGAERKGDSKTNLGRYPGFSGILELHEQPLCWAFLVPRSLSSIKKDSRY